MSRTPVNSEVRNAAEAVLTDAPESARVLWLRAGCWSQDSFRNALVELVAAGRAVRTEEPIPSGVRALYRKAAPAVS